MILRGNFIRGKMLLAVSLFILNIAPLSLATEPIADSLERFGSMAQGSMAQDTDKSTNASKSEAADIAIDEPPLLEFVEKHQPRLLKLLKFMKKGQPQQYKHALKELARVKQRLTMLEKRDSESHAIELELWQVRSNLRMLVAEILVTEKDSQAKLRSKLHELVERELDLDTARLTLEQNRLQQRLDVVKSQLSDRTGSRDEALSKAIKTWENRAFKSTTRPKKQ